MRKNKQILYISLAFFLFSAIILVFLLYPFFKDIKSNSKQISEAKSKLLLSKEKKDNLEQTRKTYQDFIKDLNRIDLAFVDPKVPVDVILFWESLTYLSDISINLSPLSLKKGEKDQWNTLGFQMTLEGSFVNFLKFLEKLETGPYFVEIDNISIRRFTGEEAQRLGADSLKAGDVQVNLLAKVFSK